MFKQRKIEKLANKLAENFPEIKAIIQFGSSVSGDYNEGISDVDLAIITKSKKPNRLIEHFISREYNSYELQNHVFSIRSFIKNLKQPEPLSLSILYTGTPLYGNEFYSRLKNKNFKPTNSTVRKCMLNSFAALGLAISDLTHGMFYDSVNSTYHAARSSIWATLLNTHITPNNKKVFELVNDRKVIELYKKIIDFRGNIPNYEIDLNLSQEIYKKGNINRFTQLLNDAITLIKINYKKIFKKNFIGLFELFEILNKKYDKTPNFYSVMLSVDWKKEIPLYQVMLSFNNDKMVLIDVDSNNGKIKELMTKNK